MYLWEKGSNERKLLYGIPIDTRQPGQQIPLTAFFSPHFTHNDRGILLGTALFTDTLSLGYLDLKDPSNDQTCRNLRRRSPGAR